TPNPAAAVVLEAHNGVDQLLIVHAIVQTPHAVPATATRGLAQGIFAAFIQRPLPAKVDLLAAHVGRLQAVAALVAIRRTQRFVRPGHIAPANRRTYGALDIAVVLDHAVGAPALVPVDASAHQNV